MFEAKDHEQYQKINVPATLKHRILEAHQEAEASLANEATKAHEPSLDNLSLRRKLQKNIKHGRMRRQPALALAAAAILVLLISSSLYFNRAQAPTVYIDGNRVRGEVLIEESKLTRYVIGEDVEPMYIGLTVKSKHNSTVRVSDGLLIALTGSEATKEAIVNDAADLTWSIYPDVNEVYQLTVTNEHKSQQYELRFDPDELAWTLAEAER